MAASDPYEEWKAQGRPGGSFEAWMAEQGGASQGQPPQQAPQPQGSARESWMTGSQTGASWDPNNWKGHVNEQLMNEEYQRLIGQGTDPAVAARAVQHALGGVEHDFKEGFSDQGYKLQRGQEGGALGRDVSSAVDQYMAWQKDFDPSCPPDFPYRGQQGQCAEKPDDTAPGYNPDGSMKSQGQGGAGGMGGGQQKPPTPVTVGKQLSMTGDPMQDMLINQYNTGMNSTYGQGMNIFGLGEDRAVGGTGANADMKPGEQDNVAQSLRGGGLWYGQDKATFGGWDATKDQAMAGVKQTREQKQDAKAYDKGKKNIAAPVWKQPEAPAAPEQQVNQEALTRSAPGSLRNNRGTFGKRPRSIGGMLGNRYSPSGGIF